MPLLSLTWFLACALLADATQPAAASEAALDQNALMQMNLEELMQVSVATGRTQKIEEAPAIVTLVTRAEIDRTDPATWPMSCA